MPSSTARRSTLCACLRSLGSPQMFGLSITRIAPKPRRFTSRSPSLILCEGIFELREQVVDALDPDRQADQPVVDAELRAVLRRDGGVRHDRRQLDQALDAAEALGQREEMAAL